MVFKFQGADRVGDAFNSRSVREHNHSWGRCTIHPRKISTTTGL